MNISIEHLDFNNTNKALKHLSKEEIFQVILKYYKGEKIKDTLDEYDIILNPSSLVKSFPPVFLADDCDQCGAQLRMNFSSRSTSTTYNNQPYCPDCGHKEGVQYCHCVFCEEDRLQAKIMQEVKRKTLLENKKRIVRESIENNDFPEVLEENLSQEDKIFLAVILRAALSEDISFIEPLDNKNIAPTDKFRQEIIRTLLARGVLSVSLNSDLDAFTIEHIDGNEEDYNVSYNIFKVSYKINVIPEDGKYDVFVRRLMYPEPEYFDKEFCYNMWRKVALNESEQYLLFEMNKVRYSFNPGEKTYTVLENLLDHFSTAQIYSIIYRSVANSTRLYQSGEVTKVHAQNIVISSCESQGARALAENWNLKPFGRRYDLPESLISEVLFNSIMKISILGFSETPTIDF